MRDGQVYGYILKTESTEFANGLGVLCDMKEKLRLTQSDFCLRNWKAGATAKVKNMENNRFGEW